VNAATGTEATPRVLLDGVEVAGFEWLEAGFDG
jgi:hypothetical protein